MSQEINLQDTPEEREERKRAVTRSRIVKLAGFLGLALILRMIIKDPPPPQPPAHSKTQFRALPGMLDAIPESARSQLDPILVAKMKEADALGSQTSQLTEALAKNYAPADAPLDNKGDQEQHLQERFLYAKRQKRMEQERQAVFKPEELTKEMLVLFKKGGYVKAEQALQDASGTEIIMDKTMLARLPNSFVKSVSKNAKTWQEPIPTGYVRLRPARGITMVVAKETAKRISARTEMADES